MTYDIYALGRLPSQPDGPIYDEVSANGVLLAQLPLGVSDELVLSLAEPGDVITYTYPTSRVVRTYEQMIGGIKKLDAIVKARKVRR